jgi:hypothetical protein
MVVTNNRWYSSVPWEAGYDISADQTEFATSLRIPFLTSPYPSRDYRFGIVVNTDDNALWRGEVPTDEEVTVIAAVRNSYTDYFFPMTNVFRREMEAYAPYDIEGGKPGHYFIKRADGSWAYRRSQWSSGPEFVPDIRDTPATLAEIIDRAELRFQHTNV